MKNLKLQKIVTNPNTFSHFNSINHCTSDSHFITSHDGKLIFGITYQKNPGHSTVDDRCVYLCAKALDSTNTTSQIEPPKPISLLDILHDVEEEEIKSLNNSSVVGVVHGTEDDESEEFGEILDSNNVHTIVMGLKSGHLIKIQLIVETIQQNDEIHEKYLSKTSIATIIGSFDDGLVAMTKSPDEELVIAVSDGRQGKGQQVIIMSAEFDLLVEQPLDPGFEGSEQAVNVGWGTKETQFHGKAGKAAAKTKPNLTPSASFDDGLVNIVWREDCQYFAISHLSKHSTNEDSDILRRIRIFDREGTLLHTSELVGGLESGGPLSWKPSGSLLGATVRKPNGKYVVAFFEKNGLMHGEFELRQPKKSKFSQMSVTYLNWNKDSTVLMVVCKDRSVNENEKENKFQEQHFIQLWTVSNYRWHLKQCLTYKCPVVFQQWTPLLSDGIQHSLAFLVITADGCLHTYRYAWKTDCSAEGLYEHPSSSACPNDMANVAVIDGCIVKITPFGQMVVPPPISAYEIQFKHEVRQVIFPSSLPCNVNTMIVVTTNDDVIICKFNGSLASSENIRVGNASGDVKITASGGQGFAIKCDVMTPIPVVFAIEFKFKHQLPDDISNYCILAIQNHNHHSEIPSYLILAAVQNTLLIYEMKYDNSMKGPDTSEINDNSETLLRKKCKLKSSHSCDSPIFNIASYASYEDQELNPNNEPTVEVGGDKAVIQLDDGKILVYEPETDSLEPWLINGNELQLAAKCVKLSVINATKKCVPSSDLYSRNRLLSISEKNRLYLDGVEIAIGVTSFFVHSNFLLATTLQHTLRLLPLGALFTKKLTQSEIKSEMWLAETTRALERGSRIVVAVPSPDTKVVLQMPRGNLEVINPRPLALHIVKSMLDKCQYKSAMEIFRRQRINQNLIVDHNPAHFLNHVRDFVVQISSQSINRLCLFIADLLEEDCTVTMFQSMYNEFPRTKNMIEGSENVKELSHWNHSKCGKIWTVCTKLLEILEEDVEKFFLPIISCLVKRTPTTKSLSEQGSDGLEASLLRIQVIRTANPQLAEEALSFLSLLVVGEGGGGDRLFDAALGVYDFDLVLFVAEKSSQKDPKEYLPFLNELRMLPQGEEYRKYRIDMHLQRYKSALNHIIKHILNTTNTEDDQNVLTSEEEEFLNLVKEQRLYSEALKILTSISHSNRPNLKIYSKLLITYGDYLLSKKYYEDAALMFETGQDTLSAIAAWEKSGNWSYCLALASQEKLSASNFENICRRLVERLKGKNKQMYKN